MGCPSCDTEASANFTGDACKLLMSAYILGGLAMMLNIRLSYSSAPYALIRFQLPENLFSVFVRRMASALELWCLPSMLLGNIIDLFQKLFNGGPELRAIIAEADNIKSMAGTLKGTADSSNKLTAEANQLNTAAQTLASGKSVTNAQAFKEAYDKFKAAYDADTGAQTSLQTHWDPIKGVIDGANLNPINKSWKFGWIICPSIASQWLNFLTYVILLVVYLIGGDQGRLTTFYFVIAISGFVFGINMTLVYSVDFYYIPVYIAGENSFPILTSFIHYLATLMFGNRRKWNSDFLLVEIDILVAIIISFAAAVVWTYGYLCELGGTTTIGQMKHIHVKGFGGDPNGYQISPFLMIVVGMGLVYAIYPGVAPGMIVPFYLIDKIEMVLLIATIFPPVIIAILRIKAPQYSPQHYVWQHGGFEKWTLYKSHVDGSEGKLCDDSETEDTHGYLWHFFDLLIVIKISLAAIFIYSLHYRESHLSRSIINQPKMSTFLSITFYMCHEILLAVGFSGFIGNNGGDYILIPQYIGALFMIFLAFYSEGYIIEYKSHDHAQCRQKE